jgi:hypothetical protein
MIWLIPAGIAVIVVILFLIFFRETKRMTITEENTEKGLAATPLT